MSVLAFKRSASHLSLVIFGLRVEDACSSKEFFAEVAHQGSRTEVKVSRLHSKLEGALYLQQLQHSTRYERLVDPEAVVWRT